MRGVSNHDAAGSAGHASINAMAASYLQRTAEEEQKHRKALKDKEEEIDSGAITRPLIVNSFRAVRALMEAGGGQQARSAGAAHDRHMTYEQRLKAGVCFTCESAEHRARECPYRDINFEKSKVSKKESAERGNSRRRRRRSTAGSGCRRSGSCRLSVPGQRRAAVQTHRCGRHRPQRFGRRCNGKAENESRQRRSSKSPLCWRQSRSRRRRRRLSRGAYRRIITTIRLCADAPNNRRHP